MFNFFKSAPTIDKLPKDRINSAYRSYRIRMFLMMFIGYAGYYIVRKDFAIASPFLIKNYNFTKTDIGLISTGLAVSYGLCIFVLSSLADKSNVKSFLSFGLLASSIITIFMGFTTGVWMFLILMIINGLFQSMGAPPCSIIIGKWFSQNERGLKMGIWNTSHNVGGGIISPLATLSLFIFGANNFKSIFFVPAILCIIISIFVFFIGADTP